MLIEEKQKMGGQKGRCLAEVVGAELMQKMDTEDTRTKVMYQNIYQKCFKENRIGRMDSSKLSEAIIKKYQREVIELYGLGEEEITVFMDMFQSGLEKLENYGILVFFSTKAHFIILLIRKEKFLQQTKFLNGLGYARSV